MPKEKKVSEIISGAIQLMNNGGWTVGSAHDEGIKDDHSDDTFCALGALSGAAEGIENANDDAYEWEGNLRKAGDLVAKCAGVEEAVDIPNWNDHLSERTGYRSVKRVFCKALNKALETETPKKGKTHGAKSRKSTGKKSE